MEARLVNDTIYVKSESGSWIAIFTNATHMHFMRVTAGHLDSFDAGGVLHPDGGAIKATFMLPAMSMLRRSGTMTVTFRAKALLDTLIRYAWLFNSPLSWERQFNGLILIRMPIESNRIVLKVDTYRP